MNPFKGRHFQRDIILWAVRWYCKYGISYRELQEMLAERGVNVDHSTIYRWVQRYAPEMEKRLRWYWRNPSDLCPWHMDETYVKVNGRWAYLSASPYMASSIDGNTITLSLSAVQAERVTTAYFLLGSAPIDSNVLRPTKSHWLYVKALKSSCSPFADQGMCGPQPITPFFAFAAINDTFTILVPG